jgi:hypothetical protein
MVKKWFVSLTSICDLLVETPQVLFLEIFFFSLKLCDKIVKLVFASALLEGAGTYFCQKRINLHFRVSLPSHRGANASSKNIYVDQSKGFLPKR